MFSGIRSLGGVALCLFLVLLPCDFSGFELAALRAFDLRDLCYYSFPSCFSCLEMWSFGSRGGSPMNCVQYGERRKKSETVDFGRIINAK